MCAKQGWTQLVVMNEPASHYKLERLFNVAYICTLMENIIWMENSTGFEQKSNQYDIIDF